MQSVEEFFENSDFPLNTQIFATSDFGDLTSSQLDSPFEDDAAEDKIFSCSDCNKFLNIRRTLKDTKRMCMELMKTDATIAIKTLPDPIALNVI
ncbi:hypothetical protein TNCV_3247161 [Trichonephila clavipes]|nr:hypothetical protein TNCV_3372501 [Trichonephila clavipes]GFW75951.1 hypothetical protein TNCV_3247161 [Trichonephila clavipes]